MTCTIRDVLFIFFIADWREWGKIGIRTHFARPVGARAIRTGYWEDRPAPGTFGRRFCNVLKE